MRMNTLVRKLIGVTSLFVEGVRLEEGLVVRVRPRWLGPRCGGCGRRAPRYDRGRRRRWHHLGLGRTRIQLEYAPCRVHCSRCGVRVEKVPWAGHRSGFTHAFEEMTAYLAQVTDQTTVKSIMGIAWETVGAIVQRIVDRRLDPTRVEGLQRIGIDEFSYRRRHRYLTVVVDHDRRRVVWAAPGRSAQTLRGLFEELGRERCAKIRSVTIDMSGGYLQAIREFLPNGEVVFDRFHVQRLASDAVDAVRREQLRDLRGTDEGKALFRSRFVLWKNPWNLTRWERQKLHDIERMNQRLYRAYLLKETLAQCLDYKQPARGEAALRQWLGWASRSKLKPFVRIARTIRRHLEGILAYVRQRLTNGIVEGFNTRLRMIARRAYGFHTPQPLIAMLYLCCGGIELDPPLPAPTKG